MRLAASAAVAAAAASSALWLLALPPLASASASASASAAELHEDSVAFGDDAGEYARRVLDIDVDVDGPALRDDDQDFDVFDDIFDEEAEAEAEVEALQVQRRLMTMYMPLQCNADAGILADDSCLANASSFSALVAAQDPNGTAPLVVPCGQCVTVDVTDGSTVTLPRGLDVVGRLHFPPEANVVLETTAFFVQGQLDMTEPAAGNSVTVSMFETQAQYLYPHMACSATPYDAACSARKNLGTKPVVVAGGKLNVRARPSGCPGWTRLTTKTSDTTLRVDSEFASCVKAGDDLLVTSSSTGWTGDHVRSVASVSTYPTSNTSSILTLTSAITSSLPGLSGPGEPELAVEVATLTRSVNFVAQNDNPASQIGGHLIVYHTPNVPQLLSGVHFKNFGQGGILGRYPIHFHMSGDSTGSEVSGNVVTQSNQRCVVIHGTNRVNVSDNVAYNNPGHCYITEDGSEQYNVFAQNLGARTRLLQHSNGQSDSPGGPHLASTFWIRNMRNEFVGNVAAGSQSIGWWFEFPQKTTHGMWFTEPVSSFRDNVAHSCAHNGMTTYKHGYFPTSPAVFDNIKIYKNAGESGWKSHHTGHIIIKNSFFADNKIGIRYGIKNNGITLKDSIIKGLSWDRLQREGVGCPISGSSGIYASYNVWPSASVQRAMVIDNVTFERFVCNSRTINPYFDSRRPQGYYEGMGDPMQIKAIITRSNENTKPYFNCGDKNAFMEDFGGGTYGLSPSSMGTDPGFIIRNNDQMKAFLPAGSCQALSYSGSCSAFCKNVCLRYFFITRGNTAATKLVLSNGEGVSFAYSLEYSKFRAVLPAGSYHGTFYDANDNEVVSSAPIGITAWRAPKCADYANANSFTFDTPEPTTSPSAAPSTSAAPTRTDWDDPILLSQGKPSSHKCNYGSYSASRGNDGVISTARSATTHTCTTSQPWWKVDLQGTKEIKSVSIWNRGDCCRSRLKNFYLKFMDDSGKVTKQMYHPGEMGWTKTLYPGRRVFARYVQIQLAALSDVLSVSEVQVMGFDTPTAAPLAVPFTAAPITALPTGAPVIASNETDTVIPTAAPSTTPSEPPVTGYPTASPSTSPSDAPVTVTAAPTAAPSTSPSDAPVTDAPTTAPSTSPSVAPSAAPSTSPSDAPVTSSPSASPSDAPSTSPSGSPTKFPTTAPVNYAATDAPTKSPSAAQTSSPSDAPSDAPTKSPTASPSASPSDAPVTSAPTAAPSASPSNAPTTLAPSYVPNEDITWTSEFNLARGQPTAQSSNGAGGVSSRAVDGNTNGRWRYGSVTHTNSGDPRPWWRVVFSQVKLINSKIDRIVVYNRSDGCCRFRIDGVIVSILDADRNVLAQQTIRNQNLVNTLYFDGVEMPEGGMVEITKDPAKTDTVISLAEVMVMGRQRVWITEQPSAAPTISNAPSNIPTSAPSASPSVSAAPSRSTEAVLLSQGKPASHKCNYGSYAASRGVDGYIAKSRGATTHTCGTWNAWWKVDLLATKEIDRVSIWNRGDCCQFRLRNFYLQFYDESNTLVKQVYHAGEMGWTKTLYPGKRVYARYVQIQLTANDALSVTEVQVMGWDL